MMQESFRRSSLARPCAKGNVGAMSYPAPFHRLVMIGSLYTVDTFNVTLSIIPTSGTMPAVTQTLADQVRAVVGTWWPKIVTGVPNTSGGIGMISAAQLTSIKLNRIGTDGLYMDPDAIESLTGTPISGGGTATLPAQLSLVTSLRGIAPRARAGRGRMYFPPTSVCGAVTADGRLGSGDALGSAQGVRNLFGAINDVYLAASIPSVVGIASKAGLGAFQGVDVVSVGRVVDTMRSRRNKLAEDYQEATM